VQCIQRRISTLGGGATELDEAEGYEIDLFTAVREDTRDRVMALGSVQLALDCANITDLGFMGRYALELARVTQAFPADHRDDVAKKVIELFRRHGATVRAIAIEALKINAARIVDRTVAPGSLLAILASQNLNNQPAEDQLPAPTRVAVTPFSEKATAAAIDGICVAIDTDRKLIRVIDCAALRGATIFTLLKHLIEMSAQDRAKQLAPKKFNCKLAKQLADDLELPDEGAVTQAISRARKEISEGLKDLADIDPGPNAVIENVSGRGYRLNPSVTIVSLAAFMEL
jgi:DNA-binding response OmpR family regulator